MLYYKFVNNEVRGPEEDQACHKGRCPNLDVSIRGGFSGVDCRGRIYSPEQLAMTRVLLHLKFLSYRSAMDSLMCS